MALKLVKTGHFETIQFPFNFIETKAEEELFPTARELWLGILVMKPFGGGAIDNGALAFKFLRNYPDIVPLPGFEDQSQIDEILNFYNQVFELKNEDLEKIDHYRHELGKEFCRRCEYCLSCPNKVTIPPAMQFKLMSKKMNKKKLLEFVGEVMEAVPNCTICDKCVEKCPYDLNIPEIIQRNYEYYLEVKNGKSITGN